MKWVRGVGLAVGIALFSMSCVSQDLTPPDTQNPKIRLTGTVTGSVHFTNGEPAPDARVELRDLSSGRVVATTFTSRNGDFQFSSVSDGNMEIVTSKGLAEARDRVFAHAGFSHLNLTLSDGDGGAGNVASGPTVSVAQYKVPSKARDLFRKAQNAVAKQKIDEAQSYLGQALEMYPNFAEALTLRAILHLDGKQAQVASVDLERAIECDPNYALAYLALGSAYNILERPDDSLRVLERGTTLAPLAWQGYFETGRAYLGKQDWKAALGAFDKAERFAPKNYAQVHLLKAQALLQMKDYPEAVSELQAFLDRAPKSDPDSKQVETVLDQVKALIASNR